MTIRQLEVFLAIARAQSFSRPPSTSTVAADAVRAHAQLEQELGVPLFVRHSRSVTLTEAGRVFEDYATRLVATLAAGSRPSPSSTASRAVPGRGREHDAGTYVLPALIARFRKRYPGVTVELRVANSRSWSSVSRTARSTCHHRRPHAGTDERCVAAGIVDELQLIVPRDIR